MGSVRPFAARFMKGTFGCWRRQCDRKRRTLLKQPTEAVAWFVRPTCSGFKGIGNASSPPGLEKLVAARVSQPVVVRPRLE